MARTKQATRDENAAAAYDTLCDVSARVQKAADALRGRIDQLEEQADVLRDTLASEREAHAKTEQVLTDRLNRETTALQTRLHSAEEKLRKVQATLA